MNVSKVFRHI